MTYWAICKILWCWWQTCIKPLHVHISVALYLRVTLGSEMAFFRILKSWPIFISCKNPFGLSMAALCETCNIREVTRLYLMKTNNKNLRTDSWLVHVCMHTHTHTHMCMQTHKQADQQQHWWLWSLFQWNTITLPGADSYMQSVWTGKGRHFVVVGWIIKACLIAAISLFDAGIFLKPFWSEMKNLVPRICTLRNAVTSYQFSWPLDLFLRV